MVVALLVVTGCSRATPVDALAVLDYDHCAGLEDGLTLIDYDRLARLRGGRLITTGDSTQTGTPAVAPLLVALSRGPQPTTGYGFTLESATRTADTAFIRVTWREPSGTDAQAQVITEPCLVVALPRSGIQRIEAADQTGQSIGTIEIR